MRTPLAPLGLALLLLVASTAQAARRPSPPTLLERGSTAGFNKAMPDTFCLYGGPGSLAGKFQDAIGTAEFGGWTPVDLSLPPSFVGDFSKTEIEVPSLGCVENPSGVVHFIDDGTEPRNLPGQTTGGETGTWTYAGFVVNRSGGLSSSGQELANEVRSPEILWDDPGTSVDNGMDGGLTLQFDVYEHLPYENGIYYTWSVRSFSSATGWSAWRDRDLVYYNENPGWITRRFEVGDLLVPNLTKVQVALGVVDMSIELGLPGTDSTPGPYFDNVKLSKHQVGGPFIWGHRADTFQDSFPNSGAAFDTLALFSQSIRLDIARDINEGGAMAIPGDSLVVSVAPVVPGTSLLGPPTMTWFLVTNPIFDGVRTLPPGATLLRTRVWKGFVAGQTVTDSNGNPDPDRWFFDLPDGPARVGVPEPTELPMFFPGDLLYFHVEATDTNNNTTSWLSINEDDDVSASEDCGGGGGGIGKGPSKPNAPPAPRPHEPPSGLPDVWGDTQGKNKNAAVPDGYLNPRILVWDDAGDPAERDALTNAMGQNGLLFGRDYGVYSTLAPSEGHSNGLGGHHGATAPQLEFYDILIYLGGSLTAPLISDGSGVSGNDRGDDLGVLSAWRVQNADRAVIAFADNFGSAMTDQGSATQSYLRFSAGVNLIDRDVSDGVGTIAPNVQPEVLGSNIFTTPFEVVGVCNDGRKFDQLEPLSGALASHRFYGPGGMPGPAAGIWRDRIVLVGGDFRRRVDATFPFGLLSVVETNPPTGNKPKSARAKLMAELLTELNHPLYPSDATPTPETPLPSFDVSYPYPNPFNPHTNLALHSDSERRVEIRVYDAKGRLVRELPARTVPVGRSVITWDGTDGSGANVASGAYYFVVESDAGRESRRAVLVK